MDWLLVRLEKGEVEGGASDAAGAVADESCAFETVPAVPYDDVVCKGG